MLKKFLILFLIQIFLCNQVMASSRVDAVLQDDRETLLSEYFDKKVELRKSFLEIQDIEQHLKKTRKGESIYLKLETVGGAVILAGVVIGSYKAHFPPGFRAMVSAYVSVWGLRRGLIKLNDAEVKKLLLEISSLYKKISDYDQALVKKIEDLCKKVDQQHYACQTETL